MSRFRSWLGTRLGFSVSTAGAMVLLRLLSFDWSAFFRLRAIPSHDMYQGAAMFATSMHAIRLTGELAWWNPVSSLGFAQYYEGFVGPTAPTWGHVVFIVWGQAVRALALLGISVPEYVQYLTLNYVVLPFLAFGAVAWFCSLIFERRAPALLVVSSYALSGIGLWNSAWFYFQEPFDLFLLLAAAVAALQRPTRTRMLLLAGAIVVHLAAFNYWTLYNCWFVAILLGSYCALHRNQVSRLLRRVAESCRRRKVAAATGACAAAVTLGLWGITLGSIASEQAGNYRRGTTGSYTIQDAFARVQEMRLYTTELFNPSLESALRSYPSFNPMHNARYIGAVFLPLLPLVAACRWRRREKWLVLSSAGILVVCLAPAVLLRLWEATPFMNRIQHLFYFYTQHWQFMLTLLAGTALDRLLCRPEAPSRRHMILALALFVGGLATALMAYGTYSQLFAARDPVLEANLHLIVLALVSGVALLQIALYSRGAGLCVAILVTIALGDLTRYYWLVSERDRVFTAEERFEGLQPPLAPLPEATRAALGRPWSDPDPEAGFAGGLYANMPIVNHFWPQHYFTTHRFEFELRRAPESIRESILDGAPLSWHPRALSSSMPEQVLALLSSNGSSSQGSRPVLLQTSESFDAERSEAHQLGEPQTGGFAYAREGGAYNDFSFSVSVPDDGWLVVRQLWDRCWKIQIDGRPVDPLRADFAAMALPVTRGNHRLEMQFRPLARALYRPASVALEALLLLLGAAAVSARRGDREGRHGTEGRETDAHPR